MTETNAPQPAVDMIGGKYRVIRVLGEGGMGAVYEAENTWTRRRVAVKVMHPEEARNPEYVRRFLREAQAASKIKHENVVDVLDMGEDPGNDGLYIVYEVLVGHDLRAHLRAVKRLPPGEALDVMVPVMEALAAVHEAGVVHRDLKPENIFLCDTPRGVVPKVIDFGIAKVTTPDPDNPDRTVTGQMLGTPFYMSPEQVTGESDIDARADVWAAAVVLYELLAGARPYEASKVGVFVHEVLSGKPRPLDQMAPDLPAGLVDAIHRALVPRGQRYPTMRAFIDALMAVRGEAPTRTPTPTRTPAPSESLAELADRPTLPSSEPEVPSEPPRAARDSAPPNASLPTPPPAETPARHRPREPLRARLGLGAAAVALVAAAGAWLATRGDPTNATPPRGPAAHTAAPRPPEPPREPPATPPPVAPPAPAPAPVDVAPAAPHAVGNPPPEHERPSARPLRRRSVAPDAGARPGNRPNFVAE